MKIPSRESAVKQMNEKKRWRAKQNQESLNSIREANTAAHRRRIERATLEELQARRDANTRVHRRRIDRETVEQSQTRQAADAALRRLYRERRSQAIRNEAINFDEAQVESYNCGPMNVICQFCSSKNFYAER